MTSGLLWEWSCAAVGGWLTGLSGREDVRERCADDESHQQHQHGHPVVTLHAPSLRGVRLAGPMDSLGCVTWAWCVAGASATVVVAVS